MKTNQRTVFMSTLVIVVIVLMLSACSLPNNEKASDEFPALPTKIPEIVEEIVEEAEEAVDEVDEQLPVEISQLPFMEFMEAEQYLLPYAEFLEGMIFSKAIDLEVVDIVDDSANAQFGFMFEALVTVRNNGLVSSPSVKMACEIPGSGGLGGWRWTGPLAPGESRELRTGFTSSSMAGGTHDYTCTVDADNTLIEFNKSNNAKTITINPVMTNTDLRIVSIEELGRSSIIGYDHEFKVTIENVGPERSYKGLMRCSYQKTIAADEEQVVLFAQMDNPGDTIEVLCGFNDVPSGSHNLIVEIDYGDQMDETNEKNNFGELKFGE